MIRSFRCRDTEQLFHGLRIAAFHSMADTARRKLLMLNAAANLQDLRVPPNNRLEALKGNRSGQFSIRINDQYRICFRWADGAHDVEIVDYH